jgi:hypothetical protein
MNLIRNEVGGFDWTGFKVRHNGSHEFGSKLFQTGSIHPTLNQLVMLVYKDFITPLRRE